MDKWRKVLFSELCNITRGASPRPINNFIKNTGMPWVKISDATASESRFISITKEYISNNGIKKSKEVFPGDLILSNSATPGLPKLMQINACIHDGWMLLRNFTGVTKEFVYWLLLYERKNLVMQGNGSIFTNLKTDILKNHEVEIPGERNQKEIVEILNSLQEKIELLNRQNKTLESLAETLFRQWFVEEASKDWGKSILNNIISIKGGGTPSTKIALYWDGNICWSSPKDLSAQNSVFIFDTERKITVEGLAKISSGIMPVGTVLLSSRAPIGYLAITEVPLAINQGYIAIICDKFISKYFIYLWCKINMQVIKNAGNGSVFQEVAKSVFKQIQITVPPKYLLDKFNLIIEPVFDKIKTNQQQMVTLKLQRDTLLPKLMSGEIRITQRDKNNA